MAQPTERERKAKLEEDAVLARLMGTADGRAFVRRLLARVRTFGSVFKRSLPQFSPEQEMWFRAARHDFGVWLNSEAFRVNPVGYQQMNTEHYEVKLREATETQNQNAKADAEDAANAE